MANIKLKRFYFFSVFLIIALFSLCLINAINLHIFTGKIIIGSNTSTTGAFVAAYVNGVIKANCTVGNEDCGFGLAPYSYSLAIESNEGDALVFTIYNVTANNTYTFAANTLTPLNLTITQLAESDVCKWSEACSGGYCCLKSAEYHGTGVGTCQARACTIIPSITNPSNQTYRASMTIDFNVSLDDTTTYCGISIDNAANASMTSITTTLFGYSNTFTSVGAHQVKYSCYDSDTDWNFTAARWFNIESFAPNVTIEFPSNNSNFTGASENITIAVEDTNKNYTGVYAALKNSTGYYKLDGTKLTGAAYTAWTNLKRSGLTNFFNSTLNADNFAGGSYLLYVNASDNTTNIGVAAKINITIDNTAPAVALISPTNATDTTTAAQTFQCNASDSITEVNNITLYIYDSSNSSIVKIASSAVLSRYNQTNFSYTIPYLGTFLWNCRANDSVGNWGWAANNRTITLSSVPVTPTPGTSGPSGGGGGTVTGGEVSQTKYSGLVASGGTKELTYTKEELKITGIEITAASQIDNVGITVKESSAADAGIAITAGEGGAYKYLQIIKTVEDKLINKVKVSFKVEKSWFTSNNYDPATTVLRRNANGAWQDLATIKTGEDASYYYFEAESPGLSYFAITARKVGAAVIPPEGKKAVCGDSVCELNETCSNCAADCGCKANQECVNSICQDKTAPPIIPGEQPTISRAKLIAIGAGILFVLAIVIILLAMPKKKKDFTP